MNVKLMIRGFVVSFLLMLTVASCDMKKIEKTSILLVDSVALNYQDETIDIKVTINEAIENVSSYGVIIRYGNYTSSSTMLKDSSSYIVYNHTISAEDIVDMNYLCQHSEGLNEALKSYISIRPYYIVTESDNETGEVTERVIYANIIKTAKISELVESAETDFEKHILDENKIIYVVNFSLDTANYIVATLDNVNYNVNIRKPLDYNYIYVDITIEKDYTFFDNTVLIVNNETVTKYTIDDSKAKIEYKISDPNWTPIY